MVKKDTFHTFNGHQKQFDENLISRENALKKILGLLSNDFIVVSTTGVTSRELFELREKYSESHEKDFLTVGGMGHASQIALGISLFKKNRIVYCIDGDGALLMHMGSLAINANNAGDNFKHIVINNCAHDSVGGQPTVGDKIDLTGLALSAGYVWAKTALDKTNIKIGRAHV